MLMLFITAACAGLMVRASVNSPHTISTYETEDYFVSNQCLHNSIKLGDTFSPACVPSNCGRRIVDGLFSADDITKLHGIVQKGMSHRESLGGPTILDINTGYIRDSKGLENLFTQKSDIFSDDDFGHYGRIINKLKDTVASTFVVSDIYFTAPTFITRLDGSKDWNPLAIHDEYWHPHADMNNTAHYHYSGLLYMSTYGTDFTGGRFKFLSSNSPQPDYESLSKAYEQPPSKRTNTKSKSKSKKTAKDTTAAENSEEKDGNEEEEVEMIVEPRAGRVAIFTAGPENTHRVEKVTSGERFVLSFWFTCDKSKQFEIFLDGKAHTTFSHKMRDAMESRSKKTASGTAATKKKSTAGGSSKKSKKDSVDEL